jgi:hypothetical protein
MSVLEKFDDFHSRLESLRNTIDDIQNERKAYCRENIKEIKNILPCKDKVYKVKDPLSIRRGGVLDDFCYFKVTSTRLDFRTQFNSFWDRQIYPRVKGEIYDINMRKIDCYEPEICISQLEEITEIPNTKNQITCIYLMIDKNTGYYKIGRSKNPKIRESTLQSEKPTIEMIFNIEGKVNDEKVLHDMFSPKRIRGEWFDLNGSDIIQIKKYFNIQA